MAVVAVVVAAPSLSHTHSHTHQPRRPSLGQKTTMIVPPPPPPHIQTNLTWLGKVARH